MLGQRDDQIYVRNKLENEQVVMTRKHVLPQQEQEQEQEQE